MSDEKLPETLSWYRDTFKWFVALAAGILGFSVTLIKDHPIEKCLTKVAFILVCVFFGLSALSGVWAYLWTINLGNSREAKKKYQKDLESKGDDDPARKGIEKEVTKYGKRAKTAEGQLG